VSEDAYLGDGVYVSFDGYQIWLAADDHRNKVVALEPDVMARLIAYWQQIKERKP
jgi:sulfur transfer complex TusBCD TusB component (DsrH family)